jgi:hypothetical protein
MNPDQSTMNPLPIPSRFFDRATLKAVVEAVAEALRTKTGFSLVRLGDGEGPILCWPDYQLPGEIPTVLNTWFGPNDLPEAEISTIADGLRHAVRSADVLGLPTKFQITVHRRYEMVFEGLNRIEGNTTFYFTDAGVHWYLQWSGAMARLLRGRDFVGVIGCRDLGPQIADTFGIGSVHTYLVRGEHGYTGSVSQRHWPDGFAEVMQRLDYIEPGTLFLVAAGVLGKIYCDKIKSKGGVALDIGSILDMWENIPSRKQHAMRSTAFLLQHLRSINTDWESMLACLDKHVKEFDMRETTY